jgi:tocopherol O-methyltransferase
MISAGCPVSAQEVGTHYDELDAFYREIWGEHVHHGLWEGGDETPEEAVVNLVRYAVRGAHVGTSSHVCDVGCGYGATARLLALEYGAAVSAVTVSATQYRHAISQTAGAANPRYFLCDWLNNDLPSEAFEALLAIESSEHMQDKENFFPRRLAFLREGGAWLSARGLRPKVRVSCSSAISLSPSVAKAGSRHSERSPTTADGFRMPGSRWRASKISAQR